jgi:hypothetical protein
MMGAPRKPRPGAAACRLVIAVLACAAVGLAGCDTPTPSVAPTPTFVPEPTPNKTSYVLGTDVWYAGLILHLDQATTLLDARGGTVDVAFRIDNPGTEAADLDAEMTLVVAGQRIAPTRESHVPTTQPGGAAPALLTFELQGIASAADGVLEIGAEPDHIAKVPFTPAAGEALTFQPIEQALKGTGAAGTLQVTLRRGVLRWDLPDWNQELTDDLRALTVTYDVKNNGEFTGGFAFTGENIDLRLPNGKFVHPRTDGHSQSIELIGPGSTRKGLFSRFEVPVGAKGKFLLIVRNGQSRATITFTING